MKNHVRKMGKRKNYWKRALAAVMGMAVFVGGMVFGGETARAKEAPFVDISTDMISLSPQAHEVKMNVAARNMPEGTELVFQVANEGICSVRWVEKDVKKYTQLCCQRGEMTGDTVITVFAAGYPESARQISVVNKEAADSYEYEGNGSTVIRGLYMPPVPYEVHVVSEDADGYFALTYSNTAGDRKVLVDRAGAYEGSVTIGRGTEGTNFDVLATGRWKITMTPVLETATPVQSGTGSQVSGCFRGDNKTHSVYCANWADKGNFIVWLYDADDNSKKLLANGAGTYGRNKGNVYLNASHSYYISVESEGNWLVEFSK
mgnify:CR=1 FL=1